MRARLRDAILDKNHGLRCILFKHINEHQHIILDNDKFYMVPFLQEITFDDEMVKTNADQKLLPLLTSDFMQTAIKHMDTEFDIKDSGDDRNDNQSDGMNNDEDKHHCNFVDS